MLCEACGKYEAVVHIQTLAPDGSSATRSLCQRCATRLRTLPGVHALDISEFLGALFERIHQSRVEKENDRFEATCPACGLSYDEYKKEPRLGCAECYAAFREPLEEALVKRNGSALYVGETPGGTDELNTDIYQIKKLREQMLKAVEDEKFETAAAIRDEIRALEQKIGEKKEA